MRKYLFLFAAAFAALTYVACTADDDDSTKQVNLNVRLTDGPGDYQQVNVDIAEVRVKMSDDSSQWITLTNGNYGIFNLLDYQNGVDTLLASGQVPNVFLKEVRLVLGDSNSIMVDSILYDLQTPSAQQSGLKIKLDKELSLEDNLLLLDFDAAESIVKTGNGGYILKPVIKVKQ
jgi:hypothetical protein